MTINEIQDNIIEDFSQFDDWMDKYSLLIDLGNSLQPLEEKQKNPQNIIEGCQSRVWLDAEMKNGIITYQGCWPWWNKWRCLRWRIKPRENDLHR